MATCPVYTKIKQNYFAFTIGLQNDVAKHRSASAIDFAYLIRQISVRSFCTLVMHNIDGGQRANDVHVVHC